MNWIDFGAEEEKRIALRHSIFDVRPHIKLFIYHYRDLDRIAEQFGRLSQDIFEFASKLPAHLATEEQRSAES